MIASPHPFTAVDARAAADPWPLGLACRRRRQRRNRRRREPRGDSAAQHHPTLSADQHSRPHYERYPALRLRLPVLHAAPGSLSDCTGRLSMLRLSTSWPPARASVEVSVSRHRRVSVPRHRRLTTRRRPFASAGFTPRRPRRPVVDLSSRPS